MFGLSGTELAIVLVLALLLLGPAKLPELARSLGKALRDFKRATGDLRNTVESEFYRMDQDPAARPPAPPPAKAEGTVPATDRPEGKLPDPYASELGRAPEKADEKGTEPPAKDPAVKPADPKS